MRRLLPLLALLLLLALLGGGAAWLIGAATTTPGQEPPEGPATAAAGAGGGLGASASPRTARPGHRRHVEATAGGVGPGDGDSERDASRAPDPAASGEQDATTAGAETSSARPASDAAEEPKTVHGRVVGADGAPIADARVLVVRVGHGWVGARTAADGSFEAEQAQGEGAVEVRVAKPGHRMQIVPWSQGDVAVHLEPEDHPPQFGVVRGIATDSEGKPLSGRLVVESYDAMEDYRADWATVGAGGAFEIVGFPAGYRRLRLLGAPKDHAVEVQVPEDDSVPVQLRSGAEAWPGDLDEETYEARHAALSSRMTLLRTDAEHAAGELGSKAWQTAAAMEDLESRWRAVAPTREVVVSGLPGVPGAVLRAASTHGPTQCWTARIAAGRAVISALTFENWRLSVDVPGGAGVGVEVAVVAGEGPQPFAWPRPERGDE